MSRNQSYTSGDAVPVRAFTIDGDPAGEFESISKASRALFIRKPATIWNNAFCISRSASNKPRGVKSYKTGMKYVFEVIHPQNKANR